MEKQAALAEAYKRGILPDNIKIVYEEALRRRLIKESAIEAPIEDNKAMLEMPSNSFFEVVSAGNKIPSVPSITETISNIPSSAVQYGKDLLSFIAHPKQSAENLGRIAGGGVAAIGGADTPDKEKFDAFLEFYKDRYGSLENLKHTIEKDPVGLLADMSMFLTGGGAGIQAAGKLSRVERIARAGAKVKDVGIAIEPLSAGMTGAGKAASLIPESTLHKMYESSAKFSTVLSKNERSRLTQTALKNDISPTVNGVMTVNEKIEMLNAKISQMIDNAQGTKRGMPIDELFKELSSLKKNVLATSGDPIKGVRAIEGIKQQIIDANIILRRTELTPVEAQKLKQTIYKELEGQYAEFKNSPVNKKAKKLIAKSAKEYLEEILPEIKELNANEGALIDLRDAIQRSANRITNRDIIGIGAPIKASAGGAFGGTPGAIAGYILGILDTPAIKSKLAIVLNNLKQKGIKVSPMSAAVRMGLINLGRYDEATPSGNVTSTETKVDYISDDTLNEMNKKR